MSEVDLSRASFVQIQIGLFEHEEAGENSRAWPEPVRRLVERELAAWRKRNPQRTIVRTRSFAIEGQCTVELYHVDPSELAPATSDAAPAAPPSPTPAPDCMRCGE